MPHLGLLWTSGMGAVAVGIVSAKSPAWIGGRQGRADRRGSGMPDSVPAKVVRNAEAVSPVSKTGPCTSVRSAVNWPTLARGARVVVITWAGYDPMSVAIKYDLWRPGREDRDLRAVWEGETPDHLRDTFTAGRATHLLLTGALVNVDRADGGAGLPAVVKRRSCSPGTMKDGSSNAPGR